MTEVAQQTPNEDSTATAFVKPETFAFSADINQLL